MRQTRFFSSENKRLADETSREPNSHFLNGRAKPLFLNKMLAPRRTAFAPARRLVHRPRSLPPKSVWPSLMQASKKNVWTDAYSARLLCLTTMSSRLPSLHAALLGVERRAAPGGRDENLHGYAVQVTGSSRTYDKTLKEQGPL